MKKKIFVALTVILVLAFAVPAFGALTGLTDTQKQEIKNLDKQIVDLRKQMVDKYVAAGQITADHGKAAKDRIDQAKKYRQDNNILPGQGIGGGNCGGNGAGSGGAGCGMNGGIGFGKRGLGAGNNVNIQ